MANLVVEIKKTDEKVHFEAIGKSNPSNAIPFDYAPPLGNGQGFAGLEILLMGFAGCVSTTILFVLGRLGKHTGTYTASAEGIRRERPLSLEKIHFHIRIKSEDIEELDMENAIKQAESLSPVWQAMKNNVTVETTFELL
ncbi:MAG: OsmC family protein [Sphaerochaeta sp.]|nr:OsmC family protein [Sphaerochaeta sp.]